MTPCDGEMMTHITDIENTDDNIPEWKKKALESGADSMAAPFGGSWNAESNLTATAAAAKQQQHKESAMEE